MWLLLLLFGEIMNAYVKLKQNWEFHRAYNRGKACVAPTHILYVCKGKKETVRLGITAGKKLGCAVKRNRAKRLVTAAFNTCLPHIANGYDYVVVARTRILKCKSTDIAATLQKQLKDEKLWIE